MFKKISLVVTILILIFFVSSCADKVPEIDLELERATQKLGESGISSLRTKAELSGFAFSVDKIKMREATIDYLYGGLKNDFEEDSDFEIYVKCFNLNGFVANIAVPRTINVKSNELKIFEIKLNPRITSVGLYNCDFEAKSEFQTYNTRVIITME